MGVGGNFRKDFSLTNLLVKWNRMAGKKTTSHGRVIGHGVAERY